MLSNSLKRLNRTNRLITVDDISDSLLAGRSAAHTACWKYLQLSSYDSALEHANSIIRKEPEKPDGYVFKARALFQLKRFTEAEDVLLHVMAIAQKDELIRSDVEGMIKLKDELANSRVEILRSHNFREPIDIAEMHWNDCKQSILELIGFPDLMEPKARAPPKTTPMEVDVEIVDIIGPEKARQLYPDMQIDPKYKSAPNPTNGFSNFSSYSKRRATSHSNLDIGGEFPTRDRDRTDTVPASTSRNLSDINANDIELRTAGLKTALMLAEEKGQQFERKCLGLEEELKKVYQKLIKSTEEKKNLQKKCDTLEQQLDKIMASPPAPTHKRAAPEIEILNHFVPKRTPKQSPIQRERVFTNTNRDRFRDRDNRDNRPYQRGAEFTARLGTGLMPDPYPVEQPYGGRYPPGILPAPPHYGMGDGYRGDIQFKYRHNY